MLILENLQKQFEQDEQILLHKASLVEQLVIRLQLDELNELQRAQSTGIVHVEDEQNQET